MMSSKPEALVRFQFAQPFSFSSLRDGKAVLRGDQVDDIRTLRGKAHKPALYYLGGQNRVLAAGLRSLPY